jgi:hypothetical protein
VLGVDLVAAAVVAALAQQAGNALERPAEGGAHRFGGTGDLAGDVVGQPAEPGAHAADLALGRAAAAAVDQPGDLAPGMGRDARAGLRSTMPCWRACRPRISTPWWTSLLSVGCVTALGRKVVSMLTRATCFGTAAPARRAAAGVLGEQQVKLLGADALAPAGNRGAIQRHGVLEVALAAEDLDVGAVEKAGTYGGVGEAVHVLDQVQADHEAGRQPGTADALAIERAEGDGKAIPVDHARETHQGMAAIDEVHRAERTSSARPASPAPLLDFAFYAA